jgi:hypothetical protein
MSDITKNEKVFELLEETETNWSAKKIELIGFNKDDRPMATDSFGIFKSSNDQWLGTVGKQYVAMQNAELAEVIIGLQDVFGGEVRGGSMQDGKRIYYQNTLPDEFIARDTLKRQITCLNSHNGSSSIGFGSTNTVVSCSNTFYKAMKDLSRFRHTLNASDRLKAAVIDYKKALMCDEELMVDFKRMSEVKLSPSIVNTVIENLFKIDKRDSVDFSTRKKNQILNFQKASEREISEKGENLWGLFNAVTYFTNHMEVTSKTDEHVMIGGGYKKNLMAYCVLANYAEDKKKLVHSLA